VYVFVRNGTSWTQQAKLLPSDGAADDEFGTVSLFGDTALIGAHYDDDSGEESGSAYVFVRDGASWTQQSKLLPSDGAAHDFFGGSVSLFGDTAVISASHDDVYGPDSGAAYVFVRDGTNWTQQAKLLPSDGGATDYFGWGLAVFGDTALIGARWDDDNGLDSGSAYVFVRDDMTWTQQAKLLPSDGAAGDHFGRVALYGDTALVGAILSDDNGSESGSAYVFVRNGTNWTRQAKLLPSDGAAGDFFGVGTSVSGDVAWVGANRDDDNGENSGAAYVFRLRCGDGILDPVEECDDGNNDNGDGCAADCTIEESDVPATSGLGMFLLVLVISGCTAYFLRRSTTT
jgi:cysteine-rich repeat protein